MSHSAKERFLAYIGSRTDPSILVIRNGMLGDIAMMTPVLVGLRETFPDAAIDAAVGPSAVPLLEHAPLRKIFAIPAFSITGHIRFFLSLRSRRYDVVIVLETNTHYTLMAALLKAHYRIGLTQSLTFLLDIPLQWDHARHAVENQYETVREWTRSPGIPRMRLEVAQEETTAMRRLLLSHSITDDDRVVVLHPGCSGPNSERQWTNDRFAQLADMLVERHGVKIVLTGVSQDLPDVDAITKAMRRPPVVLAARTSLRQLMALLQRASLVIGCDTGTLHIANGVGTPVIMMMGFADKGDTGAFDADSTIVTGTMPCIPCVHTHPKPAQWDICKARRPVVCMEQISVEQVCRAAQHYMERA